MTTPSHTRIRHLPIDAGGAGSAVRGWLAIVAALVFAMIVAGGLTRLTDSGLSITEWQPIMGAIPPLSEADWQAAFAKYQSIPQFKSVNSDMTLAGFKTIFWWEWAHRFLGRFIGVALAVPLAWFWLAGRLSPGLSWRVLGVGILVGIQGGIGWYMVKSGLADRIDVSPYRLALHLSVAFAILGCLVWLICDLGAGGEESVVPQRVRRWAYGIVGLLFAQVALGGLVAGLKAGRAFNTWPLMDGRFVPDGIGRMEPWWLNLTENMATVQFDHRVMAYAIVGLVLWHAGRVMRDGEVGRRVRVSGGVRAAGVLAQAGMGIATVVNGVPPGLGIAHQALAAAVFVVAVGHAFFASRDSAAVG